VSSYATKLQQPSTISILCVGQDSSNGTCFQPTRRSIRRSNRLDDVYERVNVVCLIRRSVETAKTNKEKSFSTLTSLNSNLEYFFHCTVYIRGLITLLFRNLNYSLSVQFSLPIPCDFPLTFGFHMEIE